ncbi:MAG: DUF1018 domain-containing protein [Candidatus Marinimicrobia bacterium]|jgi:succinate dehydrogenase flavin-adding protein (antitoxin of CptAB toxin-antitoxin module)|nr:regulatory protein GemA [Candidatus Omnitrophota bacterium]MDD5061822.1 DUF1018 domain-containing protein [Candidatus Neomarinimicrobiota bacterium]MDD5230198.1 DUF1018 domain-containing protein [Candidatus Neomarinimicrobiota bacterium]MDD5540418.1 DUF1018 domain-containing protein [Candidatus Neomarinimicrobiota bacterium]
MAEAWQIKKIHTLCSKLKISTRKGDRDEYDSIMAQYNAQSSTDLSKAQADDLIQQLEATAVKIGVWKKRQPRPPEYATPKQFRMIWGLWNEVSYVPPEERRKALDHFLKNHRFAEDLDHVYRNQVGKIIKTLEAMR